MMISYRDISNEKKEIYRFSEPGVFILFAKNRSGNILFSIDHSRATAHIFFVFEGFHNKSFSLSTIQKHAVPGGKSHLLVKSALKDASNLDFTGSILIEKQAQNVDASLENKNLLVGKKSFVKTQPRLEILANNVRCKHSASTAPLNLDSIVYLRSRGISSQKCERLLIQGFLEEVEKNIYSLKTNRES